MGEVSGPTAKTTEIRPHFICQGYERIHNSPDLILDSDVSLDGLSDGDDEKENKPVRTPGI